MKRTLLFCLLLALLAAAYLFMQSSPEPSGSIGAEDRDFITKDATQVETITIKSLGRPLVHLKKEKNQWFINNKYLAKQNVIQSMLGALSNMTLKYIPPAAENRTALNRMNQHGIEIKTYDSKGALLTDFILGTNTNDEYGTYCLKSGSQQAYVMSVPIIEGGIRNYFTHGVPELRDLTLFDFDIEKIQSVKVIYPKDQKNSFEIKRNEEESLVFKPLGRELSNLERVNNKLVETYLLDFKNAKAEYLRNEHMYKDSIKQLVPFMQIDLMNSEEEVFNYKIYSHLDASQRGFNTRSVDGLTEHHQFFYVETSWGDFYSAQRQALNKFFKKVSYFY